MGKATENMKKAQEIARFDFYNGLSCSESVFDALWSSGILEESDAPYSACSMCAGFGGGIGLRGLTCGALSGAVLAVGARHGRKNPKEEKPDGLYDLEYKRYNNLVEDFTKVVGSPLCQEITRGFRGEEYYSPQRKAVCAKAVEAAVRIACKYLDMTGEEVAELSMEEDVRTK